MWKVEFDDYGGYDGITAGYRILDGEQQICVVDVRDFLPANWSDEQGHEENKAARAAAELIVRAVNMALMG